MENFQHATAELAQPLVEPSAKKAVGKSWWHKFCAYWKDAASVFKQSRMIAYAALVCALRVVVKSARIPLAPNVNLTFDCYVNSIGALIYGPLMGLVVGAISDTLGCIFFPKGAYFFPYIFVEMSSSFIFALFFWKKKLTASRAVCAKCVVSIVCNIIMNPFVNFLSALWFKTEGATAFLTAFGIVKNLVLFPLEGVLICLVLNAFFPAFKRMGIIARDSEKIKFGKKEVVLIAVLFLLGIALALFYAFFLYDFIKANNIIFWGK